MSAITGLMKWLYFLPFAFLKSWSSNKMSELLVNKMSAVFTFHTN